MFGYNLFGLLMCPSDKAINTAYAPEQATMPLLHHSIRFMQAEGHRKHHISDELQKLQYPQLTIRSLILSLI